MQQYQMEALEEQQEQAKCLIQPKNKWDEGGEMETVVAKGNK